MNDDAKRSRKVAGAIGAAVGVAAIAAIVVVVTGKDDSDEEERVSSAVSVRDAIQPQANPVTPIEPPGPKWEREPRNAKDTTKPSDDRRATGILNSSALTQGGAFASLTGTGDISSGFDDTNIYGGLLGNEAGEMNGGFGYSRSGLGSGGGGTGWGTIGTGRYGTIGRGGTGSGYGVGGRGGMRGRTAGPVATLGQPAVSGPGDLDKAIVRRYLKRNLAKMTYCYEKELLAKPALEGTVSASFTILESGVTSSATASGVDPNVSTCIAGVLGGIEFPKPKNSGNVKVSVTLVVRPK